jgi:hypothetical protein
VKKLLASNQSTLQGLLSIHLFLGATLVMNLTTLSSPATKLAVAFGATITIGGMTATTATATTLTGFMTTGDQMAGMQVTANFNGGGSETLIWASTGAASGGVTGTGWALAETGDTFDQPWNLNVTSANILSLVINAIPGNAVFDIISTPETTPGSSNGLPFTFISGLAPSSFAYSVPIDISQGDLFGVLTLNWATGITDNSLSFRADTDSGRTDDPVSSTVPTPALLPGLIGLGATAWRKRRNGATAEA